ncbi:hypothetical protein, partial [Klebsiella pneumoniae]|uniref:hypothetical protein n=1 Tax=Klebsiella pneumoniae TaxID=573 RepID=UPI001D0DF9FA
MKGLQTGKGAATAPYSTNHPWLVESFAGFPDNTRQVNFFHQIFSSTCCIHSFSIIGCLSL